MSTQTIFKLVILTIALIFAAAMAWVGIGFVGTSTISILLHAIFVLIPLAAIVWTLAQHFQAGQSSKGDL